MAPPIKFQHNGTEVQTFATLSLEELSALQEGTAPRVLLLQDLDGVHNVHLSDLAPNALQLLIAMGCCFNVDNQCITDPGVDKSLVHFVLLYRPLLQFIDPVLSKLGLVPMFGSQRLAMEGHWFQQARDSAQHLSAPPVRRAQGEAPGFPSLPSFQYFATEHIDQIHEEVVHLLMEQFHKHGGMTIYVELAAKVRAIVDDYHTDSPETRYLSALLDCFATHEKHPDEPIPPRLIRSLLTLRKDLCGFVGVVDEEAFNRYKTNPIFSSDKPKSARNLDPKVLAELHQAALFCINQQPTFSVLNSEQEKTLKSLHDLCKEMKDASGRIAGGAPGMHIIYGDFFDPDCSGLPYRTKLREVYFKWVDNYKGDESKLSYFQHLWGLYLKHLYATSLADHKQEEADRRFLKKIQENPGNFAMLSAEAREEIEGRFNIPILREIYKRMFLNFYSAFTNGNKAIIYEASRRYLENGHRKTRNNLLHDYLINYLDYPETPVISGEAAVPVSDQRSLIDDHNSYAKGFKPGAFIHADVQAILDSFVRRDPQTRVITREVALEDLNSLEMLACQVQQLIVFRPPLMVLALLATQPLQELGPAQAADRKTMTVNLVNHPLFDAAISACFREGLNQDSAAHITDTLTPILNNLIAQVERLPSNDPVYCHRFAAQFLNWFLSTGQMRNLSARAKCMLQQAKAMTSEISYLFLLARVFKAICSDIKVFYPDLTKATQSSFTKVADALGLVGVEEHNVLKLYDAYDETLLMHMKTMTDHLAVPVDFTEPGITGAVAVEMSLFEFDPQKEVHVLRESPDVNVFDQLFCVNPDGQHESLRGHPSFATTTQHDAVTTVTVHVAINQAGSLVFNDGGGALSASLEEPIPSQRDEAAGIAEATVVRQADGMTRVTVVSSLPVGFCAVGSPLYSVLQLIVSEAHADVLLPEYTGSAQEMQEVIKEHVESLHLDRLSRVYYYRMACIVLDYLKGVRGVTLEVYLDALRILPKLLTLSQGLQLETFAPVEEVLTFIASPGQVPLDLGIGGHARVWKVFIALVSAGVLVAGHYPATITSEFFEEFYNVQIEDLLNEYVFPAQRIALALGYSWFAAPCLLVALKLWDVYKYGRASVEQREVAALLQNFSAQTRFQNAITYLRAQPYVTGVPRLFPLYDAIIQHQQSVHGPLRVYVENPDILADKYEPFMTSGERNAIAVMRGLKSFIVLTPFIGAYFMKQGLEVLHSQRVEEISDTVVRTLIQLGVLLGGPTGVFLMMPIITMMMLLPDDALLRLGRSLAGLFSCSACHHLPEAARAAGQTIVDRIGVGASNFYQAASGSSNDPLRQPLLPRDDTAAPNLSLTT